MKLVYLTLILLVAVFFAIPVQESIPPVAFFLGARVLLLPVLVCYAGLALPLPIALLVAVVAGVLNDIFYAVPAEGALVLPLGVSVVFFTLAAAVSNAFRPLGQRGHGWILFLLAPLATGLFLLTTYGLLCIRTFHFAWGEIQTWRIFGSAILSTGVALGVYLILSLPFSWPFASNKRRKQTSYQSSYR